MSVFAIYFKGKSCYNVCRSTLFTERFFMKAKKTLRQNWPLFAMLVCTGIAITVAAIIFKTPPINILPYYISLIIMALSARANRYALVMGGINSILYGFVNLSFNLPGQAAYCFLFSFPVQIVTFVLYTHRRYGTSTLFRKMSWGMRGIIALGFAVCWVGVIIVLGLLGGDYVILDTTITLFGLLITFLTMFAFIEAPFLNVFNSLIGITQFVSMIADGKIERTPFLIFSIYSFVCVVLGLIRTVKLYREQQFKKKEKETNENCMA